MTMASLKRVLPAHSPLRQTLPSAKHRSPRIASSSNRNGQQTESEEGDHLARLRAKYAPSLELGVEDTVDRIMEALRNNNEPYYDFGIEVLYRFAGRHASPFGTTF